MLIFIAIPTKGTVTNRLLTPKFLQHLAQLQITYPMHTFIAPMVQDYAVLPYMTVSATWAEWGHHCKKLIEVSDEVWVLQYDGWDTSVGVQGEITHAATCKKQVMFIAPFNSSSDN